MPSIGLTSWSCCTTASCATASGSGRARGVGPRPTALGELDQARAGTRAAAGRAGGSSPAGRAMARKMPSKSLSWNGAQLVRGARTRSSASSAMIMLCTIGRRSSPWNMCSVRQRPMPSAPNSRARVGVLGRVGVGAHRQRAGAVGPLRGSRPGRGCSGRAAAAGRRRRRRVPLVPSIVIAVALAEASASPIVMEPSLVRSGCAVTPQTAGLPMPTATMAAWLVLPPRAVRMPWASIIPWKSSGVVSSRTRMTCSPALPRRSASSAVKTTAPTAAPGEALTPRGERLGRRAPGRAGAAAAGVPGRGRPASRSASCSVQRAPRRPGRRRSAPWPARCACRCASGACRARRPRW